MKGKKKLSSLLNLNWYLFIKKKQRQAFVILEVINSIFVMLPRCKAKKHLLIVYRWALFRCEIY